MKDIKLEDIAKFKKNYENNYQNKIIENAIRNNGIDAVCLNQEAIQRNPAIFNIELPQTKSYNQKKSGRCWCFATVNSLKYDIAKNMNIDPKDLDLSLTYLTFYDKLEKANTVYENVISSKQNDLDFLRDEYIMRFSEGGWYTDGIELIKKYGLVPATYMKESHDSEDSNRLIKIMGEKIKNDVKEIIELKENNNTERQIRQRKEKMVEENYVLLSKVLGNPIDQFTLEYYDKDKKIIHVENMTPMLFKEKYLTIDVGDFVSVRHMPRYNRQDYKHYTTKYDWSIYNKTKIHYIQVPVDELEKLTIQQLEDKIPVSFMCQASKMWNRKDWILDSEMYDYEHVLNFKPMNKTDALNFDVLEPDHGMVFTGVHIIDEKPLRWKVENSWGTEKENSQYLTMNNNFFDDYVEEVLILKKYLTPKMLTALAEEPIEISVKEW